MAGHGDGAPSDWVRRWAHLAPAGAPVLDAACGRGRHARWLAERGHPVTAVDRSAEALAALRALPGGGDVAVIEADIESGPWPLLAPDGTPRRFGLVVVTNYLWRPLWPRLLDSLAPDGVLLVETFAEGQASVGRPSRPEFLLRHGELLQVCRELRVVAYEDGFLPDPARFVQRVAALRLAEPGPVEPARHALVGPAPDTGTPQAPG